MNFLVFIGLSVISCYSLAIAVPIHQIPSQNIDAKHQQASAIAARLFKEIHVDHHHQNDDDLLLDKLWPLSPSQSSINNYHQNKDSHVMNMPSFAHDGELELDSFDDILSLLKPELLADYGEHTDDGEENSPLIKHVQVTDERRMKAEDH